MSTAMTAATNNPMIPLAERTSPMMTATLPMRSFPRALEGASSNSNAVQRNSPHPPSHHNNRQRNTHSHIMNMQHPHHPSPHLQPQSHRMQPTPPMAQLVDQQSQGRGPEEGTAAAVMMTEQQKKDPPLLPDHLPFTVTVKLPKYSHDDNNNNDHKDDDNDDGDDAASTSSSTANGINSNNQYFRVIKSCWPGSHQTLPKSASIAEFTRYVVETLCCDNDEFVSSILSLRRGGESRQEWRRRVESSKSSSGAGNALFVYGTSSHDGDGNVLTRQVLMKPNHPPNSDSNGDIANESEKNPIIVSFTLSNINFYPKRPLPSRDNAHQIISSHYQLGEMLRLQQQRQRQHGNNNNIDELQEETEEGVNLILKVQVDGKTPSFVMPLFGKKAHKEQNIHHDAPIAKKDDRILYFHRDPSTNDSRWIKKFLLRGEFLSAPSTETEVEQPTTNITPPAEIPFSVKLILPRDLQMRYGKNIPQFARVKSTWSKKDNDNNSSTSSSNFEGVSIADFTRHIVEELFCDYPAFATTIINTRADNESMGEWMKRQSCSNTTVSFTYGSVGSEENRRVVTTKITGNMIDCANEICGFNGMHRAAEGATGNGEEEGENPMQVQINFGLSDAYFHPGLRIPSHSNAYDVLACHYRAQKEVFQLNGSSGSDDDNDGWGGKVQLLLHMDLDRGLYGMPAGVLGVKRKGENGDEVDDCERTLELSYTRSYKKAKETGNVSKKPSAETIGRTAPSNRRTNQETPQKRAEQIGNRAEKMAATPDRPPAYTRTDSAAKQDFAASVLLSLGAKADKK